MLNLENVFEKFNGEFLKFENVVNPVHRRPDICAFITLDKLVPGTDDMVMAAEHDEVWLDTDCEVLARVATEDDILLLVRCGVRFSDDALCMFV